MSKFLLTCRMSFVTALSLCFLLSSHSDLISFTHTVHSRMLCPIPEVLSLLHSWLLLIFQASAHMFFPSQWPFPKYLFIVIFCLITPTPPSLCLSPYPVLFSSLHVSLFEIILSLRALVYLFIYHVCLSPFAITKKTRPLLHLLLYP